MSGTVRLTCRIASEPHEFEAIHRLNYRTFVEEIPQHSPNGEHRLVDRFHHENVYLICMQGETLAGMVALRFQRPFSLDQKVDSLDQFLPAGHQWCEVRLLAVEPALRGTPVLAAMLKFLCTTVAARGVDAAVISATTRQLRLYRHLGFTPFGQLVGKAGAWYQPMFATMADLARSAPLLASLPLTTPGRSRVQREPVSFLPGPVPLLNEVREAMARPAVSHRAAETMATLTEVRRALCDLVSADHVHLMFGSGTLANEAVAAQISLLEEPGLVLVNGEFSGRLADHARRWRLPHAVETLPPGQAFTAERAAAALERHPEARWVWTTHCETSTSALNDVEGLRAACASRGARLCLDCVSSVGVVPVDLRGVWLASCASGKGLASFAGVSMVFLDSPPRTAGDRLPRCLDLGLYEENDGMPFTHSSNLLAALATSVRTTDWPEKIQRIAEESQRLEQRLTRAGWRFLAAGEPRNPGVLTLELPAGASSTALADRMEAAGFLLSSRSAYLSRQNRVQICLMGHADSSDVDRLADAMVADCPWQHASGTA